MEETIETPAKRTISRRAVIASGAAGAAAFWSVPVIDSVVSQAAAGSAGVVLPCSWAIVVYVHTSGSSVDNYTYFVNGWAKAGSCGQGEFKAQCSSGGTGATNVSPISVEFLPKGSLSPVDGTTTYSHDVVIIWDTVTKKFLAVDLSVSGGGSGQLAATGGSVGTCSQGVLTQNGTNFTVPSGYTFLAALSFQGCVAQFPSASQSLAVNCT